MPVITAIPYLEVSPEQIAAFCQKWGIVELSVFGSVLRDDFTSESDVDVLFVLGDNVTMSLFSMLDAQEELAILVGRPVDFIEKSQVQKSPNYIRRKIILNSAQVIYATYGMSSLRI